MMPATLSQTVANALSQLSQLRTSLRQCDSCPYPFRDRAPTVALTREGCWREKHTIANRTTRRSQPAPGRGLLAGPARSSERMVSSVRTEIKKPKKWASHEL